MSMTKTKVAELKQLLTDSENQPHQFGEDAGKIMLDLIWYIEEGMYLTSTNV